VKKPLAILPLIAGALLLCSPGTMAQSENAPQSQATESQNTPAQQSGIDRDVQMLRQDLRSKKKQTIAANLQLTDAQATRFWPVYDQYVAEQMKINDEKYAVIKQYADEWGNMNDEQALSLTNRALAVEQKVTDLRIKYVPIFTKAVPGTTVATFFQIERRVQAMVDLQLSAQLPLVQAQ
jgi:Spy/CpxP family protein refolding chaperone